MDDDWRKNLLPVQSFFSNDGNVEEDDDTMFLTSEGQLKPPFHMPTGPPKEWNPPRLISRVKVGMLVELSTIPLYLYSMYSVKPTNKEGLRARAILRGVLQQEMLHLSLVGNLLSALGGSLDLYDPDVVPKYPGTVLMDNIPMTLRTLDATSLDYFIEIEGPNDIRPEAQGVFMNAAPGYRSIGELYEDVIIGVRVLPDENFAKNPDNQFTGNNFFGDQLIAIINRDTALQSLRLIIEQGEGNLRVEDSHFDVYTKLRSDPDSWEVHQVPTDPKTVDYKTNSYIYKLSLAFDAAYCYLLQTIQRVWHKSENPFRPVLFRNIHALMSNVLTPVAEILVQQTWKTGVAAPCFNYYAMIGDVGGNLTDSPSPLAPDVLHEQLSNRMKDAENAASDAQQKLTLGRIGLYINENIKPSE